MTDAVEIYICKPGQKIEEGQMVMSNDIDCKAAAEEDAKQRCKIIPTIEKIVYYDVSGGGFKVLFSYTNPNVVKSSGRKIRPTGGPVPKKKKKAPAKKQGLWQKVKKSLGG
ncbi:hypothetical protein [Terasakiella sp. SH-1]|uniref:hypothetical protein n=1 Tax=Terasakiella sp. SH-1 TaxID=2560057 RepID=UPI001073168D|nr:hypothetical protein [Terasakiella sp. SH-1]